jgi:heme-degrading monooxygenase HmoA
MKKNFLIMIAVIAFAFVAGYVCGANRSPHIARIFHGVTPESKKDSYFEYLRDNGLNKLISTQGNQGVYVLRRVESGKADFLVISLWDSYDSMKNYAGANVNKTVVLPKDKEFLEKVETTVNNYEILFDQLK